MPKPGVFGPLIERSGQGASFDRPFVIIVPIVIGDPELRQEGRSDLGQRGEDEEALRRGAALLDTHVREHPRRLWELLANPDLTSDKMLEQVLSRHVPNIPVLGGSHRQDTASRKSRNTRSYSVAEATFCTSRAAVFGKLVVLKSDMSKSVR